MNYEAQSFSGDIGETQSLAKKAWAWGVQKIAQGQALIQIYFQAAQAKIAAFFVEPAQSIQVVNAPQTVQEVPLHLGRDNYQPRSGFLRGSSPSALAGHTDFNPGSGGQPELRIFAYLYIGGSSYELGRRPGLVVVRDLSTDDHWSADISDLLESSRSGRGGRNQGSIGNH
jgi:hypothetical protein